MTKEIYTTKLQSEILKIISEWCESRLTFETCGFIGEKDNVYTAMLCQNKSSDPRNFFSIDPLEYLFFIEEYNPVALFHSHIDGDENPSEQDIMMSENSCLPFFIYSLNTKNFHFYTPKKAKLDVSIIEKFKLAQWQR